MTVAALKKLNHDGHALLLVHFHPHWHLKRDISQPQPVLEPSTIPCQLSQRNPPTTGTRREPCGFETVEAPTRSKAQSKYSRCHSIKHIMTSKICPLRYADIFSTMITEAPAHATRVAEATIKTQVKKTVGQTGEGPIIAAQEQARHTESVHEASVGNLAECAATASTFPNQNVVESQVITQVVEDQAAVSQAVATEKITAPEPIFNNR